MNEDISTYLTDLRTKFIEKDSMFTSYIKDGNKLVKIGSGRTKREVNSTVTDFLDNNELPLDSVFFISYFGFTFNGYLHSPFTMVGEIKVLNSRGKISKTVVNVNAVHYRPEELATRGYKSGDRKRLFNKLYSGTFRSGLMNVYFASDL
jgi:hypothetical protein